ncbi:MucB/RseB C-terminal domain-containing protein [Robbsia sp. Bb-Pol-6]|uniref:MucB/RseB C-terminal domain-containing protein n=1 Tax=Robbsia betulipollinis TaxID=2981849 RepID=A0ABT3ZPS7_9BURK|nr:MucB/RseB C-terminal domain-containing protein [Robbsia betulipollinis]MCY0388551.1 MucB/RseB C-terminal domain-containing protein [Robbsia betulipollinis]
MSRAARILGRGGLKRADAAASKAPRRRVWWQGFLLPALLACAPLALGAPPAQEGVPSLPASLPASSTTRGTGDVTGTAGTPRDQREAAALLGGINAAAQRLDYQGSFVFQRGGTVQSSSIVHFVDGADQYQKVDSLDGKPRSVVQHNDDVLTFLADSHTVILDHRKTQDNFPALLSAGSARVLDVYRAGFDGRDRVAGIDCRIIMLRPVDDYRFSYRLYIDPVSGLLIRAQTLDGDAHVLEQVAFTQLQIGGVANENRRAIRNSVRQLNGWKQVRAPAQPVDMEAAGWSLEPGVRGFAKILEMRRPMAAREAGAPPVPVDQAVFTDGVTAVSLFIEPVDKSDRKPGEGRSGATHLLAEQHGAFWVTLIGEVPAATLRRFATSIQYHPSSSSLK